MHRNTRAPTLNDKCQQRVPAIGGTAKSAAFVGFLAWVIMFLILVLSWFSVLLDGINLIINNILHQLIVFSVTTCINSPTNCH